MNFETVARLYRCGITEVTPEMDNKETEEWIASVSDEEITKRFGDGGGENGTDADI